MDTSIELTKLERQVKELMQSLEQLKLENTSLRHKLASSVRERSRIQEKNYQASSKLRRVVNQLKDELL
ncbi:MAG: TIGR02449 family protein [Gammaproteobacteria bacterium]|nr:TIGR02449 family protein [Gammaproteobacteria bacterium]